MIPGKINYIEGSVESSMDKVAYTPKERVLFRTSSILVQEDQINYAISRYELQGYKVRLIHDNGDGRYNISAIKNIERRNLKLE